MKKLFTAPFYISIVLFLLTYHAGKAQIAGDYRTIADVTFASPTNWQQFNGSTWSAAASAPTAAAGTITIQSGTQATVGANISLDQLIVSHGSILSVNTATTLTIIDGTGTDIDIQGTGTVSGLGNFTLSTLATFSTANTSGLNAVAVTGTKTFANGANYIFNGNTAQNLNNPVTLVANDVTINNSAGVILSNAITITGTLTLTAGVFNTAGNTLTFQTGDTPIVRNGTTELGTISINSGMNLTFGTAGNTAGNAFTLPANVFAGTPIFSNFTLNRVNKLTWNAQQTYCNAVMNLVAGELDLSPCLFFHFKQNSSIIRTSGFLKFGA